MSPSGEVKWDLPRDRYAAHAARDHVRSFCGTLGPDSVETAALLTSELVTNALMHARGRISLRLSHDEARLRIEVSDDSPELRPKVVTEPRARGGRGLMLVATLAEAWGVAETSPRKAVWFTLPWKLS